MAHIPAGRWYDIIQEREKNTPYFYLDWKQNHFISRPKREAMIEDERITTTKRLVMRAHGSGVSGSVSLYGTLKA